jgi:diguanylate cyclase (GGDEF)-like protein
MRDVVERLLHPTGEGERARKLLLRRWAVGMVLLALAGVAISWASAASTAHDAAQHSREVFRLDATQVTANMDLAVQHETDLLVGVMAFMREHRGERQADFQRWTTDIRALERYPELIAAIEMRPPAQSQACPQATFAGPSWITRFSALGETAICSGLASLARTRDNGRLTTFGSAMAGVRFIGASVPVYRTPTVPPTLAERRSDFLGWAAIALYPQVLLREALARSPGIGLRLRTEIETPLTFSAGARSHGQSMTTRLSNGLSLVVSGSVQDSSIFDDGTATLVLAGGSALSVLLALALFLLGTSRARAMRLVSEKTGELAFQALHDALTGLPNRVLVLDRIEHALARSARGAPPVAVLFIDVDGFKTVNDTFGHGAGDELLRTVASRLHSLIRDADTVGRLGGDEFVVLLEPGDQYASPELVAERILELLNQPIDLSSGAQVRLTASIGIAAGQRENTEALLRDADLALYAAKHGGKNRFVVFEDAMQTAIADRHALEVDLKGALANKELFLVYQPTFRLEDRRIGGVEALIRWQHPTRGLIPPDTFIPIAEESGLILEIGRWVASAACLQAAAWRERGLDLTIAVNVSGKQLDEDHFAWEIRQILDETGLEPSALTLEITETSLMRRPTEAAERLRELKALGVRIAIDDFGTGYSSLAYLRAFPVDSLKIDRAFISGLGSSHDDSAFVTTLIQLGRTLHISTLGEGIEEESQLRRLLEADCDYGQGFLLARPLPAEQIEAMLVDQGARAASADAGEADEDAVPSV